jgi:hypothetical protein
VAIYQQAELPELTAAYALYDDMVFVRHSTIYRRKKAKCHAGQTLFFDFFAFPLRLLPYPKTGEDVLFPSSLAMEVILPFSSSAMVSSEICK